jgi:hypothetical protein
LTSPLLLTAIGDGAGIENYIVAEAGTSILSIVNSAGERSVIYQYARDTGPAEMVIDSSGNYIVSEGTNNILSKVTPSGVRSVIYAFSAGTI